MSQFFTDAHFEAFNHKYWESRSSDSNNNRKDVRDRFGHLHQIIRSRIDEMGVLHPHPRKQNLVSNHWHSRGVKKQLKRVWLRYGYSGIELKGEKHMFHPRLQVIMGMSEPVKENNFFDNDFRDSLIVHQDQEYFPFVVIWFVIGKDEGSPEEREYLQKKMSEEYNFLANWIKHTSYLDSKFWVEQNEKALRVPINGLGEDDWKRIFKYNFETDDYFIIGKDFHPNAREISESELPNTVISHFKALLPLYEMTRIAL